MAWRIESYEDTPNPDALKCWLDRPISERPVSFRRPEEAREPAADVDPVLVDLAVRLFDRAGLTSLLFLGQWMAINKPRRARWREVKRRVQAVLAEAAGPREAADQASGDAGGSGDGAGPAGPRDAADAASGDADAPTGAAAPADPRDPST